MLPWDGVRFYGLLYVNEANETHANLRSPQHKAIETYLRCALLCARSMRSHGYSFTLVTNRASQLQELALRAGDTSMAILERPFELNVPAGAAFYSAHFKLDLMAAFGSGELGDRVALIDIDTVLLRPFRCDFPEEGLIGYDITDQVVPAYGAEIIRKDMELVAGRSLAESRWWGGEFLAGHAEAFRTLSETVRSLWPTYLEHRGQYHHESDETPNSTAMEILRSMGVPIKDATNANVCRWWSSRTLHQHYPLSLAMASCLVHLPADKEFLRSQAQQEFDVSSFQQRYLAYATRKRLTRGLFALANKAVGRGDGRVLPRLR